MKRALSALCTLLMGVTASASIYDVNFRPSDREAAMRVCNKIQNQFYSKECADKVLSSQANRYNLSAVQACSKINNDFYVKDCMEKIRKQAFSSKAALFCGTMGNDYFISDCLQKSAGNYYNTQALNICASISNISYKNECMNLIKNKVYEPLAISRCEFVSNQMNDYYTKECLNGKATAIVSTTDIEQTRLMYDLEISLRSEVSPIKPNVIIIEKQAPRNINKCRVKTTGQIVNTDEFFTMAQSTAIQNNKCVVARLAKTAGSSRLIDNRGGIRIKNATYEQVDDYKRSSNLKGIGCMQFICDDSAI